MPKTTIKAVRTDKPGPSLAVWLAVHHPDLFLAAYRHARTMPPARGFGRLADDDTPLMLLQAAEPIEAPSSWLGVDTTTSAPAIDVTAALEPGLVDVSFDPSLVNPSNINIVSDSTESGSSLLSTIANGATSAGTSLGNALSAAGSGVMSAIGAVGSWLGTSQGQTTATTLAKAIAGTQTPAQNAVLQTQLARGSVGNLAAPITYANGLPVYASQTGQGTLYQPLTSAGLASLTPSGISLFLSQYGMYLLVGAVAVVGLTVLARKGSK